MSDPAENEPAFNVANIGSIFGALIVLAAVAGVILAADWWHARYEWSWSNAALCYFAIGGLAGVLTAIGSFFTLWYWSAQQYGFPGYFIGWVPAGVAAFCLGWLMVPLWVFAAIGLYLYEKHR
jgi:hypothetical protein